MIYYITCSFVFFTILTCVTVTHILSLFYLCLFTLTCKRLYTMYKLLSYIYHVLSNIYIYIILNIMYTVQSVIYILYPIIYIKCYPIYTLSYPLSNIHVFSYTSRVVQYIYPIYIHVAQYMYPIHIPNTYTQYIYPIYIPNTCTQYIYPIYIHVVQDIYFIQTRSYVLGICIGYISWVMCMCVGQHV